MSIPQGRVTGFRATTRVAWQLFMAGFIAISAISMAAGQETKLAIVGDPQVFREHVEPVRAVKLSPDGNVLTTGGMDGHMITIANLKKRPYVAAKSQHYDGILGLELVTARGSFLTVSCSRTRWPNTAGTVKVGTADGKWQRTAAGAIGGNFDAVAVSENRLLAVGGNDRGFGNLRVFDLNRLEMDPAKAEGSLDPCEVKPGPGALPAHIRSLCFGPLTKGKAPVLKLAVGCEQGIVRVLNISRAGVSEASERFEGLPADATVVAVSVDSNGKTLRTAATDSTIRTWDVATGQEDVQQRITTKGLVSCKFEAQTGLIVTGHTDGTIRVHHQTSGWVPLLETSTGRNFPVLCIDCVSRTIAGKKKKSGEHKSREWQIVAGDEDKAATMWTIQEQAVTLVGALK